MPRFAAIAAVIVLTISTACSGGATTNDDKTGTHLPTPDRSQLQIIDSEPPAGLTDLAAVSAYRDGYAHMKASAWWAAIAAYDEAIRIQPGVPGVYEARGTAYMYAGQHNAAIADYSRAIELEPTPDCGAGARTLTPCRPLHSRSRPSATPQEPSNLSRAITWVTPIGQ